MRMHAMCHWRLAWASRNMSHCLASWHAGLRTREPEPLVSGIMWGTPSVTSPIDIRHEARNEDDLAQFGWLRHDLRSYGEQIVRDDGLQLSVHFAKDGGAAQGASRYGAGYGGGWGLRVHAQAASEGALDAKGGLATLYWYLGDLKSGAVLQTHGAEAPLIQV